MDLVDGLRNEFIMVTCQLNAFTPVAIAIIIVAVVKYAHASTSMPTVNVMNTYDET